MGGRGGPILDLIGKHGPLPPPSFFFPPHLPVTLSGSRKEEHFCKHVDLDGPRAVEDEGKASFCRPLVEP